MLQNLFCILEGLTDNTRRPVQIFIAKDYTLAKLYFRNWIKPEDNASKFVLYKVGEINKNLEIFPCKIFITGGFECKQTEIKEYWTNKYYKDKKFMQEEIKKYKKAKEESDIVKQIEILFDGVKIKNA